MLNIIKLDGALHIDAFELNLTYNISGVNQKVYDPMDFT